MDGCGRRGCVYGPVPNYDGFFGLLIPAATDDASYNRNISASYLQRTRMMVKRYRVVVQFWSCCVEEDDWCADFIVIWAVHIFVLADRCRGIGEESGRVFGW